MDSQFKIKMMAEQQGQAMKDMLEFIESQKLKDEKAQIEADKFDEKSVVLPSVRGISNPQADIEFAKEQANKLFKEKKFKEALDAYNDIIDGGLEINNEMKATLYFNSGLCLQKLKRSDGAVLDKFDVAIKLNPDYQKARVMRARIYMRQERWQDALDDFYASGRDQNAIQDDIQKCIQNLPKNNNLIIEESSSDDASEQKDDAKESQQQSKPEKEQKPVVQQKRDEVNYTPNYQIEEDNVQQFYSKVREFEVYPKNLGQFLGQFHSSKLGMYIDELENTITLLEMEHIVSGCLHPDSGFTPTKCLNFVYQVFTMKKFQSDAEFMGEQTIKQLKNLIKQLEDIQLTDAQQERYDYIKKLFGSIQVQ